ncbi:hypothetical protein EW026_g497 [Hermanssonia centrifuga]|uniref:DRBM domain-containing protein n=1 Tax=Hermanssonia centrifuga TaxID=98765 RepID=A0A4S4KVG5_9APHY|nr:hypothetical protein EW026_g497 [Hermanssonia centrifuga]
MGNETGTVALNNYLQSQGQLTLLTWVDTPSGPAHAQRWTSVFSGQPIGTGTGAQKFIARDMAADIALATLRGAT